MKKTDRLKAYASEPYQKATGVKTIQLRGNCDCLIINRLKYKEKYTNQQHAYSIFNGITFNPDIKVTNTCGIVQCIKKEHLLAVYKPNKEDAQYIKDNRSMYSIEELAFFVKTPVQLLQDYLNSQLDK